MSRRRVPPQPADADAHAGEVLRRRARTLARAPADAAVEAESLEVVEFRLADERYAIATEHVQEVHPLRELTPLPCTPPFLLGLVNLRGRLVPVVDLRKFFDLQERGLNDLHRILLLRADDMEFGILADTVEGVLRVARAELQATLPTLHGIRSAYLVGVTAAGLVVLDGARLLADPRIVVDEEVAG